MTTRHGALDWATWRTSRMDRSDDTWMELAIRKAQEGIDTRNGEVGVVIVDNCGELAFAGFNEMNTTWDVTGHAEITALRHVSGSLKTFDLSGHTLYATL